MRFQCNFNLAVSCFDNTTDPDKNCAYSPLCCTTFFQLLRELLDDTIGDQIDKLLSFDPKILESMFKPVNRSDKKSAFKLLQLKKYSLDKDTTSLLKEKYNVEIDDFNEEEKLEDLNKSIGEWLKIYTNELLLEHIQGPSINKADTYYVKWAKPFEKSKTTREKFYKNPTESFDVDMMKISGKFKYVDDEQMSARIIELPCVNKAGVRNKDVSVLIYLPNEINEDGDFWAMTSDSFTDALGRMESVDAEISIPKFKIKNSNDLKDVVLEPYVSLS